MGSSSSKQSSSKQSLVSGSPVPTDASMGRHVRHNECVKVAHGTYEIGTHMAPAINGTAGHPNRGMTMVISAGDHLTVPQKVSAAGRPIYYNQGNVSFFAHNAAQLGSQMGTPSHAHPYGNSGAIAPLFESNDMHTVAKGETCACSGVNGGL